MKFLTLHEKERERERERKREEQKQSDFKNISKTPETFS